MEFYKIILLLSVSSSCSAITFPLTQEISTVSPSSYEYFKSEATEAKPKPSSDCEKIIKNGMMCLVCSDVENGTSEQCAYISPSNRPPKKYSGPKKPRPEPDIDEITSKNKNKNNKYKNLRRYDESAESEESSNYSGDFDSYGDYYPEYTSKSEKLSQADSNDCEEVARDDGTICTVCKDPKNGGNSQRCRRAYEPQEKVYGYTRSRSFGVPKEKKEPKSEDSRTDFSRTDVEAVEPYGSGRNKNKNKKNMSKERSQSYRREDDGVEDSEPYGYPTDEKEPGGGNCNEVERDGMICTVCVNPKTNGKSEQCSYSYKPQDELFAYTNSRSYGSPKEKKG